MTIDLDSLESAARAATPGPWENAEDAVFRVTVEAGDRWVCDCISGKVHSSQEAKDAAYIAAANPAVVLELVTELRKARAAQEWIAQTIVGHHDACAYPCKCGGRPPCEAECVNCWLEAAREAVEVKK